MSELKKRILIIVGIPDFDYSNEQSAVRSFLFTIKEAFEAKGYYVEFGQEGQNNVVKSAESPTNNGIKGFVKKVVKKWSWLYQTIAMRSYFRRQTLLLNELLKNEPFDQVIEFHTVGSMIGKELSSAWMCPFSVVFDSPIEEQFFEMHGTKSAYWSKIVRSEKDTLESAERIMVYSPACSEHIQLKYQLKAKVQILPCIIHKPEHITREVGETFNIGFVGSFLSWHKVDQLVEAFGVFYTEYPNSKLQLIGYGVEWGKIKKMVDDSIFSKAVEMPGFVSEKELVDFKRKFSVATMPGSNWYGSPLKLFEYAQGGIPFVAPSTPTVISIFEKEEHCLYIDSNRPVKSLVMHLKRLKEDSEKAFIMATNAQQMVESKFGKLRYQEKLVDALGVEL